MICPNCGNDNPVSVLYCMRCGQELSHELHEVRAAVRDEVEGEENARLERRFRSLLVLGLFVLIAAWAVRSYARALPTFEYSVFTAAPNVKLNRAPIVEIPLVEAPIPRAKPPGPFVGPPDVVVIKQIKEQAGKRN